MPIVNRLKKFFVFGSNFGSDSQKSGSGSTGAKNIPDIVRIETDVRDYWTLDEVIGDGAFGSVYKARSKVDPGRVAAAKAMELEDDESQDVMVEVSILTQCKHPNIVELYDAFTMGNRITLLLEYCGGGAVDSIMMELSRPLSEQQIQSIMKEILKALDFLHGKNVIHRDLKAGNVLLTSDARVKLADFGVSALCKDAREVRSTFIGTPYWMAPEVMICETFPEKHYNKVADIWSFGITLIEMAEEKPPYAEMNPAKVVFKVIKADPPTLERPNLWSSNFRAVVAKCLTKDPENRPTAADLLAHPFFAQSTSIQCIRSLISEMNAEQVTTEVMMGSDDDVLYDDEDDDDTATVSSVATTNETRPDDASSVSSKQQRQLAHFVTEQKIPAEHLSKSAIGNARTTTVVELSPAPEITEINHTTGSNALTSILSEKRQRAPSLPDSAGGDLEKEKNVVAVVKINGDNEAETGKDEHLGRSNSSGSGKVFGAGHHAAVEALSDLDRALNLEEEQSSLSVLQSSCEFVQLEHSEPKIPISDKVTTTVDSKKLPNSDSKYKVKDETDESKIELHSPKPAHQIRDVVAEEKSANQLLGRPTTVHITETGAIVTTTSALLDRKLAETNARAQFVRPNVAQEANFVYNLKVADNQQLKVKAFAKDKVTVEESSKVQKVGASEQRNDHGQQEHNLSKIQQKKKKDTTAYKSFDSLFKIDNEEFMGSTGTQRCLSQPQVVTSNRTTPEGIQAHHVIQVSDVTRSTSSAQDANYAVSKRPLGVSLSTDQLNVPTSGRSIHRRSQNPLSEDATGRGLVKSCGQKYQNYSNAKSASEKSSPVSEMGQLQQHQQSMRAEFKVLAPPVNAETAVETEVTQQPSVTGFTKNSAVTSTVASGDGGAKKMVVEVRRPLSYPDTNSKQKGVQKAIALSSSSRGESTPPQLRTFSRHSAVVAAGTAERTQRQEENRNRIGDREQNRKRLRVEQEQEQNRMIRNKDVIEQTKDKKESHNGTVSVHHQFAPTTSNRKKEPQPEQEYNYFETASSSSSNSSKHLQRHSHDSSPIERDSSNFHAATVGNGGVVAGNQAMIPSSVTSIPRAVLTVPPPEPPVDYHENGSIHRRRTSNSQQTVVTAKKSAENGTKAPNTGASMVGSRRSPHRQTVTKKTRVYVVDGVQMTSTSHQVFGVKQDYELRKQQLHELRRLQREEARQQRELNAKAEALRNEQAKRFAVDKENIYKKTDIELQALARTQKRQLKECEEIHNEEMKQAMKRIQNDQDRDLRLFRDQLKKEQRDLKMEMEALPKMQRKDSYRIRKEQLDKEQQKREMNFIAEQQSDQTTRLARVQLDHKMKILQIEKNFQQQKHAILRSREASEWDLEEKQLAERHLLNKQELKDRFYLQRSQMFARHQRELMHMHRVNEMEEDEQTRMYANFKKRLPKDFRTESKTRIAMFKESLRISCQNDDPATLNEKIRAFEEKEKQRVRNALEEHDSKYSRKLRELKEKNTTAIRELEEIHSEKRKMLLEAEQNKMEMYEKEYEQVVADWRSGLPIRKQALEAEFARELDEVEAFYRKENAQLQQLSSTVTPTGSISSKQDIVGSLAASVIGSSVSSGGQY